MKIYLDLLFLINFICDSLILLSVSIILRRNIKLKRIFLSALIGSFSFFVILININPILLFLLKLILASIIVIVCFKYKNIRYFLNNLLYFFINSLILGGSIYLINLKLDNFAIKNELLFNFIILVIFSPVIIYIYIRTCLKLKNEYSLRYKVDVYINSKIINLNGFYDTGNTLIDPYKRRSVIIVDKKYFEGMKLNILLVPINTVNGIYLLECFKPDAVYIKGVGIKYNLLIGMSEDEICIEGIDCLLNKRILEDL